jgi:hypothetical protein
MAIFVNPHASTTHPRTRRPSSKWALREKPHAWLPGRFATQKTRSDRHPNGMVTTALGGGAQANEWKWSWTRGLESSSTHTTIKPRLQNAFAWHPTIEHDRRRRRRRRKQVSVQFNNLHSVSDVVGDNIARVQEIPRLRSLLCE